MSTIQDFISSISREIKSRVLSVDGNESTIGDFLRVNLLDDDVEPITIDQAHEVLKLNIGESMSIGITEVKRIA